MSGSSLFRQLRLPPGSRVAVVGCNGKSSAIDCISKKSAVICKTLIAPTTAIRMPEDPALCFDSQGILKHTPHKGLQYAGIQADIKLLALPTDVLEQACRGYDLTLMEADGSKGLPLKGWAEHEPVIPEFTTHVLGVVLIDSLGLTVSEATVHRPDRFTELTGLRTGDKVTHEALYNMIFSGMFKKCRGEVTLLINGVQSPGDEKTLNFCRFIRKTKKIKILTGDTYKDIWYKI